MSISNISETLLQSAKNWPDKTAIYTPYRSWRGHLYYQKTSFHQLEQLTELIQAYLQKRGIQKDQRILFMIPLGIEAIATVFALFRIGAIPILLDPGLSLGKWAKGAMHSRPDAVIGTPKTLLITKFFRKTLGSISSKIALPKAQRLLLSSLKVRPLIHNIKPTDIAAILFTSGSTGFPKGVHYTHQMFHAQLELLQEAYGLEPGSIDYPMLGVFSLFNPALGITTVFPEIKPRKPLASSPHRLLEGMAQMKVSQAFASPILWQKLAQTALKQKTTYPSLKKIFMAGCSTPPGLISLLKNIFPNAAIQAPYGATEALPLTFLEESHLNAIEKPLVGKGTCLGKPLPGVRIKIISDNNQATPETAIGEIVISGKIVSPAYDYLPSINQKTKCYDSEGNLWHHMGDCGYISSDGTLWFMGRMAERIIQKDQTLYPDPCESIFLEHPDVQRAALIGIGNKENPTAALVLELSEKNWRKGIYFRKKLIKELQALAQKFSLTQSIQTFFFQKKLPVDVRHNAKIHRLSLADKYKNK